MRARFEAHNSISLSARKQRRALHPVFQVSGYLPWRHCSIAPLDLLSAPASARARTPWRHRSAAPRGPRPQTPLPAAAGAPIGHRPRLRPFSPRLGVGWSAMANGVFCDVWPAGCGEEEAY
ncbi:hypothetical protein PAHAL_7G215500 [Panicum hallii]|uniref:Uncharacterized protein n=1 Tax=Panicum hallii TaxID=206008 RepID=A0A2T8ID47_9POAL|nr:hypothetical protein PAHAL_7G215500 [Panicum hallii]